MVVGGLGIYFFVGTGHVTKGPPSSSYSTTSTVSLVSIPPFEVAFEVNTASNSGTLWELPANTVIWETFTLNATSYISAIEVAFSVPSSSQGSALHVGIYVDGRLTNSSAFPVEFAEVNSSSPSSVQATFPVVTEAEFTRGTNITVAAVCSGNLFTYMYRVGVSYGSVSSSLPRMIPASSPSTQEPFEFWAEATVTS
jgi:hypothetical protein